MRRKRERKKKSKRMRDDGGEGGNRVRGDISGMGDRVRVGEAKIGVRDEVR